MELRIFRGTLQIAALLTIGVSLANASAVCTSTGPDAPGASDLYCVTDIFTPSGTELATPWSTTVQLPRFDQTTAPAGFIYVLDSVTLTLNYTATGEVDVRNSDPNAAHAFTGATASVPLTVTGPDATTVNALAVGGPINSATSTPSSVSQAPNPPRPGNPGEPVPAAGVICFPPASTNCFSVDSQNNYTGLHTSGSASNSVNSLASYEGVGNANLNYSVVSGGAAFAGTEVGGSGHLFFGGTASAGGTVAVLFTYHLAPTEPAPEPITVMLVGSALIGLGVGFRRRRQS